MAVLTVQNLGITGLAATLAAAAAGGDKFDNPTDERTFLRVANGGGSSINVTITVQKSVVNAAGYGAVATANQVVAVANGTTKDIGPFSNREREIKFFFPCLPKALSLV
jgi:hypothetical protein